MTDFSDFSLFLYGQSHTMSSNCVAVEKYLRYSNCHQISLTFLLRLHSGKAFPKITKLARTHMQCTVFAFLPSPFKLWKYDIYSL